MVAIISLLIVIILSVLVTRVAAIALIHTGLSKESARFQSRSAFTGAGFTTNESESVVNHPVRRRILMLLILLGSAGVISVISSLILSLISVEEGGWLSLEMIVFITGLLGLLVLAQSKWIEDKLSNLINRALDRYTDLYVVDYHSLLHLADNYRVTTINVKELNWLADKKLKDLNLKKEGILVLGIERAGGEYEGAPRGDTTINSKDTVTVYGLASKIKSLSERKKGTAGDLEHDREVEEHESSRKKSSGKQDKMDSDSS